LAAAISAVFGLLQHFGAASTLGPWVHSAEIGQAYANLRQRNQYATLINIGLAALVWRSHQGVGELGAILARWSLAMRHKASDLQRVLCLGAAVLLAAGNAASSSRTGTLQLVCVVLLFVLWSRGGGRLRHGPARAVLICGVLAYILATSSLPWMAGLGSDAGILARFSENTNACSSRLTLWSNVLHLIAQKPWFGWGWGELDYAHFVTLYSGPRFCDILDNAHNLPLHLAVELGVPVALGVCGTVAWLVWRAAPWAETNSTRQLAWSVLALIGLHSMLEYPLWYGPFQMAVGLSVWLLWQTPAHSIQATKPVATPSNWTIRPVDRIGIGWVAMALIAFCAYAAWDYWRVSQIYLPTSHRAFAYQTDTLQKIRGTWLFQDQVRFAELTSTTLTPNNAAHLFGLAQSVLHFSPEARVVQILVESAVMLGRDEDALFYLQRFRAAFPEAHARWASPLAR
ncbi:MAG: hypothetical protein RLZZ573_1167, partial [Pseudomonadota bacterium]